jgi:crossover junction endodeoxyribonuclease RuvC
MIILGIDPGLALTGWAILDNKEEIKLIKYGCIKTRKEQEENKRLFNLYNKLKKIINKYKPQALSIEKLFFNTNAKTAFTIGEARGVIKMCATLNKLPIYEFTPLQIKDSIVGYGRADKNQVQQMVKMHLKLDKIPKPDDAADAVAAALTYCFFNQNLSQIK